MSLLDKIIASVAPPETLQERISARKRARALAVAGDWLSLVLDHHLELEDRFSDVLTATNAFARRKAEKELAILLTGHAVAEEAVLYPALAISGDKAPATTGYAEQSAVKVKMAALNRLDPMSQGYLDELGSVARDVAHHMFEEEGTWFPELAKRLERAEQKQLTLRYLEEFTRYAGSINLRLNPGI